MFELDKNADHIATSNASGSPIKIKSMMEPICAARIELQNAPKDMAEVVIGDFGTVVHQHILDSINWNSHTSATRKLLTTLFARSELASQSLDGKPSQAFDGRPIEAHQLNPMMIEDIISYITSRIGVKESAIRNSITAKCAIERKKFRRKHRENRIAEDLLDSHRLNASSDDTFGRAIYHKQPDILDSPDSPDIPDSRYIPDVFEGPASPDIPDSPESPDIPDSPDSPDSPNSPDSPDNPDSPDSPDIPDSPDSPDIN